MARLTSLETAVMDAMAWDLRVGVPDLTAQLAASSPGLRRNTGAGLYSEMSVDRNRAAANPDATGLFGTVNVMVDDLPDPIGFQVELYQGRLIALHGQSYGQDTRGIDFSNVRFTDVFTVNDFGESVLFRQGRRAGETRASTPSKAAPPAPPETAVEMLKRYADFYADETQRTATPPPQKARHQPPIRQETVTVTSTVTTSDGVPIAIPNGKVVLVYAGLYLLIGAVALTLATILRIGPIMAIFFGIWAIRIAHGQKGRELVTRIADQLDQQGVFEAIKPR